MAFGATSASASRLASPEVSAEATTFLKATPTGSHNFTANGPGSFSCTASEFVSSMSAQAVTQLSTEGLGSYSCYLFGSGTTMKMNGCSLTFKPGAEKSPGVFGGSFDVGPAGCGPITMKYLGSCELRIYPKTSLAAEFTNKGSGKTATVVAQVAASGLKTDGACSGSAENGTYSGGWELKGSTDAAGSSQTGIQVTTKAALHLSGEPAKFTGEAYPETIVGSVSAENVYTTPGGTISCKKGSFGGGALQSPSAQLSLLPAYSECTAFGFSKTNVKSGLCTIVLNATSTTSGTAAISCPPGGAIKFEPTFSGFTVCTISFPSQSLGSVTYENVGTGIDRRVVASISGSGIQYTGTGGPCGTSGSDATFSGGIEVRGEL
ncbi:MAG TPA: hypothetical protein VIS95_01480 [Solirubrobacterales bacterium]